jgi:hypothetical protein
MIIPNKIIKILSIYLLLLCIRSCNSKDNKLKSYYEKNSKLHQELSDSLMNFSKRYRTKITIQKTQFPDEHIRFDISFPNTAEWLPIYFDTSYQRHDYKPEKTAGFTVPTNLIENFDKSIYFGLGADSTYTFFAYEWDKPAHIGTSGDSQYGILILKDTVQIDKCDKKISKNVCITSFGIF